MQDKQTPPTSTSGQKANQSKNPMSTRGHLKIFLGYAAGTGKSFAMLEAAHQRLAEGFDVVVGSVDTHHFSETETLLNNLECIPKLLNVGENQASNEVDIDAILKRFPQLVLIDDLAHTNQTGSRHLKRYQDIEELLSAGISVYTTLNIQNLDNQKDVIHKITGVQITETVPNYFVENADEIEVIDLPTDELLNRITNGKVFLPNHALPETENFYRKGNLTALREIALRYAADRVDSQMLNYMDTKSIPGPWPVREKILVAVSTHPMGELIVRSAYQMAKNFDAEWTVIYVETPQHASYSLPGVEQIAHTLKFAEDLGAKVVTITGSSVPKVILDYALKHNFAKIMVGNSPPPKIGKIFRKSILKELIQNSYNIDVHIINPIQNNVNKPKTKKRIVFHQFSAYFYSILIVLGTTLISFFLRQWLDPVNLVMPYLSVVVICAYFFGRGPSMLASLLGVLAFDFFFTEPHLTFTVSDTQYLLTFLGLLVVGLIISNLTARVRDQMDAIQKKHTQTQTLLSFSRDLNKKIGLDSILKTTIDHICQTIGSQAVIFLPKEDQLSVHASSDGFQMDELHQTIANHVFDKNYSAGKGTSTYFNAAFQYQPLRTRQGVLGVLGVELFDLKSYHQPEQLQLLEAFNGMAAMAIERSLMEEQSKENQVLRESERLKSALLNSISHDLRTPLASITGALDSLQEAEQMTGERIIFDQAAKLDLIQTASEESHRLNLLVQNLLDMTQLEAGALKLRLMETDLRDLISTAISHTLGQFQGRRVMVDIPDDLPGVTLDFILLEQVLLNIFDNAVKYSEPDSPIEIKVRPDGDWINIQIADRGIGIPPELLSTVFDKFYRVEHEAQVTGTGLGLSICKGIIEAHHGQIYAENRPGGGTIILFSLPFSARKDQ